MFHRLMTWLPALWLYLALWGAALAVWPLCARLLAPLGGAAWGLARPLGLFAAGLVFWLGNAYGLWDNAAFGAWAALLLTAGACWGRWGRSALTTRGWRRGPAPEVWALEALFLAGFLFWIVVRQHSPSVWHTEQPMDLMLLNSLWNSPDWPPQDAWLAGAPIGYYHLGHWLVMTLGRLAGTGPLILYNLGQAAWMGMVLSGAAALVWAALAIGGRRRAAPWGGLLAALGLGLASGPGPALDALGLGLPPGGWWWFQSTRIMADALPGGGRAELINEFPFFSFLLGDLHAHLLSLPLGLVLAGAALALAARGRNGAARDEGSAPQAPEAGPRALVRAFPGGWGGLGLTAALAAGLYMTNAWDLPGGWLLLLLALLSAGIWSRGGGRRARLWAGGGLAAALVLTLLAVYFPFFLTAQSQVRGLAPNLLWTCPLAGLFLVMGQQLLGAWLVIRAAWLDAPPSRRALAAAGILALIPPLGLALMGALGGQGWEWWARPWTWLAVGALWAAAAALLWERIRPRAGTRPAPHLTWALVLTLTGLTLVLVPEAVYLLDNFNSRMNTVFKFHYQAWLFLTLAGTVGIVEGLPDKRRLPAAALALALTLAGLAYPAATLREVWAEGEGPGDGTLYSLEVTRKLRQEDSPTLAAVLWVNFYLPPTARVAEAQGGSYHPEQNRVSTFTGRGTFLGWQGHEQQWRGGAYESLAAPRREALERLYRPRKPRDIMKTMEIWDLDCLFLGPAEKALYGLQEPPELWRQLLKPSFASGGVGLYCRREGGS